MSQPADGASGGAVRQCDLERSILLRRRAREAADRWKDSHRSIAAAVMAGVPCEPGRYRTQLQTVEGMLIFAVWDGESVSPWPGCTAAFSPEELTREHGPDHAEAPEAEARPEAQARTPARDHPG